MSKMKISLLSMLLSFTCLPVYAIHLNAIHANALKLGRLCPSSTFDYKDALKKLHHVNAFYRIEHSVQLKEIGYYGLDTQLNYRDYFDHETGDQLNRLRDEYN